MSNIHPPPPVFSEFDISKWPILQFFHYAHLPDELRPISKLFCDMAVQIIEKLPDNEERNVTLRKLLEAKDAAVRARVLKLR